MRTDRMVATVVLFSMITPTTPAMADNPLQVSIRQDSTAGGLNVSHPYLRDDILAYLSCEAVLFGETQSTPLFEVRLAGDSATEDAHWSVAESTYSYAWTYAEGIRVEFSAVPDAVGLKLRYVLTNLSQAPLKRVLLHTCIPTTDAPAFFPGFTESPVHESGTTGNYMGFYDRTFLWSNGQRFAVAHTEKGGEEIHLSFMYEDRPAISWAWWKNGEETFDVPLIAIQSNDGQFTAALGFETAEWASCNGGDERACFHLFPSFGDLPPGSSREVKGCFYLMRGTPDEVFDRFSADFPGAEGLDHY